MNALHAPFVPSRNVWSFFVGFPLQRNLYSSLAAYSTSESAPIVRSMLDLADILIPQRSLIVYGTNQIL